MNIQNILSGFVLRPARSADGNTETTATATSGVVRHFENVLSSGGQTIFTEMFGSQYRGTFVDGDSDTEEYLLWASTNGNVIDEDMGFYWVKNDNKVRFGWDGEDSTWKPYKGSNIVNLGRLVSDETYELEPKMPLEIGSFLKGDASDPLVKATLRLGVLPTEAALTLKVKVVADDNIKNYDFTADVDEPDAVVGEVENLLVFDPNFVVNHVGKFIWYSYEDWQDKAEGVMASMLSALETPVFLTPIPDYTDRPMIRMGSRTHLTPIACRDEDELNNLVLPNEDTFGWAESTGRCKFHEDLLKKADPNDALFDKMFYEDNIVYDGISHNTQPVKFPKSQELTQNGNEYILSAGTTLSNGRFQSGFLTVPDGTGKEPLYGTIPQPVPTGSGVLRSLKTVGDEVFFSSGFAIKQVEVVDAIKDLKWEWNIERGVAMVCLANGEVRFNRKDKKTLLESNSGVFFRQGFVVPARTLNEASIPSRKSEPYEVKNLGNFCFEINGEKFVCELNYPYTYTAAEAAHFLNTYSFNQNNVSLNSSGAGIFLAYNGRLYLETPDKTGSIKICFAHTTFSSMGLTHHERDFAGSAFGFLVGWSVDTNEDICYLNDSGMSFGMFRTPYNLDRESDGEELDFYATQKTEGFVGDVQQDFFHHLDQQPLKDLDGFQDGVFFSYKNGLKSIDLVHYQDIVYQFDENRFAWVSPTVFRTEISTDTQFLTLNPNMALESSFIAPFDNGIWVSDGSTYHALTKDEDYLILDEGQTGDVAIIEQIGQLIGEGFDGQSNGDRLVLTQNHDVMAGDRVKILGGSLEGNYKVQEVSNNELLVQPQFAENLGNLNYQIFSGGNPKSIHADTVLYQTSHLPKESFIIRLVESVGENGGVFPIDMGDANTYGREVFFRVGNLSDDSDDYTPTKIENQLLGNPRNGVYVIDSPLLEREFLKVSFGGGQFVYSKDNGNCHFVNTFSNNTGDYIEIGAFGSPIEGQVRFSDEAIVNRGGRAYVLPDISDVALLAHDEFYYSNTEVFVPASQEGKVYLVQKAVLGEDVKVNPIGGALNFSKTLKQGTIVEARYFLADDDGQKLTDEDGVVLPQVFDQLPVFRRQVEATMTHTSIADWEAEIDLGGDTLVEGGVVSVWLGAKLLRDATVETLDGMLIIKAAFPYRSDSPLYSETVRVSYQVYEAEGGEQSYTTSQNPIYRPPFRLEEEQDTFVLEGDRTEDFCVGGVIWIEGFLLKILDSVTDGDATTITISPPPQKEIGSLSPANDSEMLVSGKSLFEDPNFWVDVPVGYLPADRGMTEVIFEGNLTELVTTNTVLQLGEDVFLVESVKLSERGDFTTLKLQSPLANGYKFDTHPPSVSVRPLFAENDSEFDLGESVPDTYFELVLFEDGQVGQTLIEGVHYEGNPEEGTVRFLGMMFKEGLQKGDVLWVTRTSLSELSPFVHNGQVVVPNVVSKYMHMYLRPPKGYIEGNYSYYQPDTFFCRVAKNEVYLSEVAKKFAQSMNPNGSGGSSTGFSTRPKNYTMGLLGSRGKYKDTLNEDQAARMFIEIYNRVVVGFEQVRETITGGFIGDRDGKFKFFVGRGNDLTPKGYENPFTGVLRPRNVWEDYFNDTLDEQSLNPIPLTTEDAIIAPDGNAHRNVHYTLKGDDLNLDQIRGFLDEQKSFTGNDIDDLVLVGREGLRFDFERGFWTKGVYKPMGDSHTVSRLFPERTQMFTRLYAGALIGVDGNEHGVYTNGREYGEEWYSTKGAQIGSVSNPVLGAIENISDLEVQKRYARGRVYDYSPTGFPDIEDSLGVVIGERPAVVISVVPLNKFPTDSKGLPDVSRMVSNGGDIFDASSGDYELHTPPFEKGQKVYIGFPSGVIEGTRVFVEEVIAGCVLVFQDEDENPITDAQDFVDNGFNPIELGYGDTVFIGTEDYIPNAPSDPTLDEKEELRGKSDAYSTWWDFALDRKSGKMIDKSYSSSEDDRFDWQKYLGQNPPSPFECLEGVTYFYNGDQRPAKLPCLVGEEKNDSGDYSLPYLKSGDTELQVLGRMAKAFEYLFDQDAFSGNNAVYPNEVIGRNGNLTSELLLTDSVSFLPVNGSYVPRSGLADVRPYDLLMVEVDENNPQSWQGILSVGSVSNTTVGLPRIVSEQNGVFDKYIVYNAMAHVATVTNNLGEAENGMVILEDTVNNYTVFDLSSQTTFSWEGFIDWFKQSIDPLVPEGNVNSARLQLIDHTTGAVLTEVFLSHNHIPSVSVTISVSQFGLSSLTDIVDMNTIDPVTYPTPNVVLGMAGVGWFNFSLIGTPVGGDDTVFFDFTLALNAFDNAWGGGVGIIGVPAPYAGSFMTVVGEDRAKYDLGVAGLASTVRGEVHPNSGAVLETSLEIYHTEHPFGEDFGDGHLVTDLNSSEHTFLSEDFVVPSWEGDGQEALSITDIRFSAMASSDEDTNGVICEGVGFVCDGYLAVTSDIGNQDTTGTNPYVPVPLTVSNGSLENIQEGDVLVVQPNVGTAVTSGSYVVQKVVPPTDVALPYSEARSSRHTFNGTKILDSRFARVLAMNSTHITLENVRTQDFFDTGDGNRSCFPTNGSVFVNKDGSLYEFICNGVAEIEVINGFGSFIYTISSIKKDGSVITPSEVETLDGQTALGATRFQYNDFLVGYKELGASSILGLSQIALYDGSDTLIQTYFVGDMVLNPTGSFSGKVAVYEAPVNNTQGTLSDNRVFRDGVISHIDIQGIVSGLPDGHIKDLDYCELTQKDLVGIFVEPTTPIPVQDLYGTEPRVVSASNSMLDSHVGMRTIGAFTSSSSYPNGADTLAYYEQVRFSVRRVRRWHEVQNLVEEPLSLLPPVYFKRKGSVVAWLGSRSLELSDLYVLGTIGTSGVQRGDTLRILKDGLVVEEHIISSAISFPNRVTTRTEFMTPDIQANPTDYTFEIYLKQGIIPHEQSWDELVDMMTKEVVKTGTDGSVNIRNRLSGGDFLGVQQGDLVIIDPHPEGFRPMGDRGVSGRAGFVAGLPSELDDNRGFYRVVSNNITILMLDGVNEFAGLPNGDTIFGSVGQEYAVYPTISGTFPSATPSPDGELEAQNDLRPTAPYDAILGYSGNYFSIEPFSYKIIRPSGLFSNEMIDLILTQRERTLSWMEEILEPSRKNKSGNYYTFQLEDHIYELDDPTDTSRGYGLVSNMFMESLGGVREVAPFLNTSDCLSVLDRRYWCGDLNLDYETPLDPSITTPYASFERDGTVLVRGSGRPHLIDRIDDILNSSDRLRNLRYTWISFRTDKARGTLPSASRALSVLYQDLLDEQELINIKKSVEQL